MHDIIVGASLADPNGGESGRSYVVFGVPKGDTCCNVHGLPGCTDTVIEACVCTAEMACCDDAWNQTCVDTATADCGVCG